MKMKRIYAMLMACVMAAGTLAGCGQGEVENTSKEDSQVKESVSSETIDTESSSEEDGPLTTDPITIEILTQTSTEAIDADELWIFKYLEYWMNEQGYNVTLEVTTTPEVEQQLSLMLASDNLPDLVWGINLTPENAIIYGSQEGMLLDWTPYLNEETMPNVMALAEGNPDAINASICIDGGIYSLPTFKDRGWGYGAGNQVAMMTTFVNSKWMEQCGYTELPSTWEDMIDMLRTFKKEIKLDDGLEVIPLAAVGNYLEKSVWTGLGYYSFVNSGKHGNGIAIKDGQIYMPAATEDYRTYIETMNTLYTEGLVSEDYLTMDGETVRGILAAGQSGVMGDDGLSFAFPETWSEWVSTKPMTVGDNKTVVAEVSASYETGKIWASASTEYPEVLAYMIDYLYSAEGSTYYYYGPMKGEDPLNIESGWYFNEDGVITNEATAKGEFDDYTLYGSKYIYPCLFMTNYIDYTNYAKDLAEVEYTQKVEEWPDAVLNENYEVVWKMEFTQDNADGWMRHQRVNAWKNNVTTVKLPTVYMTGDQVADLAEKKIIIDEYINAESAKFITGIRPLTEIDEYFEELKSLGADEYVESYREAYSSYMKAVFN